MVFDIVKKVKAVTEIPLFAKLTPEVKNIVDIARAACEAGADGLTLINTMPAAGFDVKKKNIPLKGGLSGPVLKPIALRAVHECSKAVPVPIIGVGGIMDAMDAISFFMAGARAIQIGTATFVDPYAIPKIIKGVADYLDANGHKKIDDIAGIAHER
jgi:dihydroorotate dehydrogenase (NAD+) catalytic subunit